jgi:hypothetical protein
MGLMDAARRAGTIAAAAAAMRTARFTSMECTSRFESNHCSLAMMGERALESGTKETSEVDEMPDKVIISSSMPVEPVVAIQELLGGSERCLVQFLGALNHAELSTKFAVKRFCVITHHFKPAAFGGALWTKCADDYVAASPNHASNLLNVS